MFWIPSRCLALATLLLSISCDSATLGQENIPSARVDSNPARIKLTTERAIVFKDGYCLIVKQGEATTDDQGTAYTEEVPDAAILGSFWATAETGEIQSMIAGWEETKTLSTRQVNCTSTLEIITANVGRSCSLLCDDTPLQGQILKVLSNEDDISSAPHLIPARALGRARSRHVALDDPFGETTHIEQPGGKYFILRAEQGDFMVPIAQVKNLMIAEMVSTLEKKVHKTTKRKRLTMHFGKPNSKVKLSLMYFRPGIRWIPTYRVALTEDKWPRKKQATDPVGSPHKVANLSLQAEILNEAEDLLDVPLHVVVGVPNFRFRKIPSPMVLEATVRNLLEQAAPTIMGSNVNQSMSNAMFSQRSGEFGGGYGDPFGSAPPGPPVATVEVPKSISHSGGNDLFVYDLERMTLKKGERATVPMLRTRVSYRDIYTWSPKLSHAENYATTTAATPSPLVLTENKVWRHVELYNSTKLPWTTGAAMFVDGYQPLAQELLTYTSAGGTCRVPITVAVDLQGGATDRETSRQLNAHRWRNSNYAQIGGRIDLHLHNNKPEPVTVEIHLQFGGKATQASDEGKISVLPYNPDDWKRNLGDQINNSSIVTWRTNIAGKQSFQPLVDYEFFMQH